MTDELERIKQRKMDEMRRQAEVRQKLDEDKKKVDETKKRVLVAVLEPDAYEYIESLKKRDAATAEEIENTIIRLVLNQRLKYKVEAVEIEAMERKIKGIEPRIVIKRRGGDEIDLNEKLKKDSEK